MGEGVVLQAEQAHIVGEVQLYPGGRVDTLIGGEPMIFVCLLLLLLAPLYHISWSALRHT